MVLAWGFLISVSCQNPLPGLRLGKQCLGGTASVCYRGTTDGSADRACSSWGTRQTQRARSRIYHYHKCNT